MYPSPKGEKIFYIDRLTGERLEEDVYGEGALRFFYESSLGRFIGTFLAKFPPFSRFYGWLQRLSITKRNIVPFVLKYKINPAEFEHPIESYPSFDAFFTRTLKKEVRPLAEGVVIPADGRYLCYQNIATCDGFVVKGKKFSLERLLGNPSLARSYAEGSMLIARLCPTDYHRFHFPLECTPSVPELINGPLYSVSPIAVKKNLAFLAENKRVITHLKTDAYGTVLFIEIGAMCVGSIHQTYSPNRLCKKGDEKGYFSFGGSSLVILFQKGYIHFAPDLILNSNQHLETFCLFGQPLEHNLHHRA